MSPPLGRRRSTSPVSVTVTLVLLAVAALLVVSGLNRESIGEPFIPDAVTHLFSKSDPGLPAGLNYDFSVLDPQTQQTLTSLPQLGTVDIRLAMTNDTALPMTLKFTSALQCEFIVRRVYPVLGGLFKVPLEVWRSSYFHNYSRQPTQLTLAPGQTKVYVAYWTINGLNQLQVPPGEYRIWTSIAGIKTLPISKPL